MENYLTREGLEKLKKELETLKGAQRQEIAERLEKCLAFGDLTENAEYHETKEEQAFVEGRILELEELIRNATVVSEKKDNKMYAQVGSTVLVSSGSKKEEFKIVGVEEADPVAGKISINSPLGQAFFNQPKGTIVEVQTPKGIAQYKILKIE
ncbi:MAG: transcription elongation factor GreA [Candidatus Nealsonbacteria bacterium]|nr:transcription elongation factor GreA [Candidatus Nealsonbacteria bacterium]